MNIWTRGGSPTLIYVAGTQDKIHWQRGLRPGRTYIHGVRSPIRRLLYRLAILFGWHPVFRLPDVSPPDDSDGDLQGSGVPLRPPDSSGSASAEAWPGAELRDIARR